MANRLLIDKRSPKKFWDDQHKLSGSMPVVWLLTAEQLLRAFQMLMDQARQDAHDAFGSDESVRFPISSTAMMLGGFAIENLLKAIKVSQGSQVFDDRGFFTVKTHDVLELAVDAGVELDTAEEALLEKLEQFVIWAGRYPIPLSSEDLRPRTLDNGGFAPRTCISIPGDFDAVMAFAEKLREKLTNLGSI